MFRKLPVLVIALALALAVPVLAWAATPININTASAAAIARSLDGIGASRAEAIVAWREAHGAFKKADDLKHVKGIGKATIERNRSAILLADDGDSEVAATPAAHSRRKAKAKAAAEK